MVPTRGLWARYRHPRVLDQDHDPFAADGRESPSIHRCRCSAEARALLRHEVWKNRSPSLKKAGSFALRPCRNQCFPFVGPSTRIFSFFSRDVTSPHGSLRLINRDLSNEKAQQLPLITLSKPHSLNTKHRESD